MISKDGGHKVAFGLKNTSRLLDEACFFLNKLVHRDHTAGFQISSGKMTTLMSGAPGLAFCFAKKATSTLGDAEICDAFGEGPLLCSLFKARKRQVTRAKVISHE
jgi:hypothetical protein